MKLSPLTIIPAGAGSGKTYRIQTQLTDWIIKGKVKPDKIVAVTFTEAAASELRERIRIALLSDPLVKMDQVLALEKSYITTIHGFGLRLIQEYCFEGGWSPHPRLLNQDEGDILIKQTLGITSKADSIMSDLARYGYKWDFTKGSAEDQFREQLSRFIQKHRLLGINKVSKKIRTHLVKNIKKLYGRISDPKLLEKNLVSAVKKLLRNFPDSQAGLYPDNSSFVSGIGQDFKNLKKAQVSKVLKKDWNLWVSLQSLRLSNSRYPLPAKYDELAQSVMDAALQLNRHPGPLEDALQHAESLTDAAQECLQFHSQMKQEKHLLDYSDMLSLSFDLLIRQQKVVEDLASRIDCVIIDEFQDTNPLQFSLLWALYREGIPTLIVGDLKQAIMGFQDADPRLLEELVRSQSKALSPLRQNWRTVKPLMEFLNKVGTGLFPTTYQSLEPQITQKSKYDSLMLINLNDTNNQDFYAAHLASHIKSVLDKGKKVAAGGAYRKIKGSDVAILLPTNSLKEKYANACREVGLQVQLDDDGWLDSRSVQLLYYALLFVSDPSDSHAALYLATTELGQTDLEDGVKELINDSVPTDRALEVLKPIGAEGIFENTYSLLQEVISALSLFEVVSTWPNGTQERANILKLLALAEEFNTISPETLEASSLYGFTVKTFLAWLLIKQESDDGLPRAVAENDNAVVISTWHSAKGREWPIVVLGGMYREFKPKLPSLDVQYKDFSDLGKILDNARIEFSPSFKDSRTNENFLDNLQDDADSTARRLLYVAMTRAKEQLIIERPVFQEGKEKQSFWQLFLDSTQARFDELGNIKFGEHSYKCAWKNIGKDEADLPEDSQSTSEIFNVSSIGLSAIKSNDLPPVTAANIQPSQVTPSGGVDSSKHETYSYASPMELKLDLSPVERGNLIHRCFEVLSSSKDNTDLLNGATGFEFKDKQKKVLQASVNEFENWLGEQFGPFEMYKEVPIVYQDDGGSVVSGVIDLLLETDKGYWIIDHKTHRIGNPESDFGNYLNQLEAYGVGLKRLESKKRVLGVAIHWVMGAKISVQKNIG